jgi:hypothetical protein
MVVFRFQNTNKTVQQNNIFDETLFVHDHVISSTFPKF